MEGENGAAPRLGVEAVREARLDARALVEERERANVDGDVPRDAAAVLLGLDLDARERLAGLLRLDDAGELAVHVEEVVGIAEAAGERELADSDAAAGVDVRGGGVLDEPPGLGELRVDLNARALLRRRHFRAPHGRD